MLKQTLSVSMRVPSPACREYVEFVATVLATFAVLQYTGIFFGDPGRLDLAYLLGVGLLLPVCTYLLTLLQENVEWLPRWERMVENER